MARSFDFPCQLALMFCTGTCLPPGADFSVITHKTAEGFNIFVIDFHIRIRAKTALPFSLKSLVVISSSVSHAVLLIKAILACYLFKKDNHPLGRVPPPAQIHLLRLDFPA